MGHFNCEVSPMKLRQRLAAALLTLSAALCALSPALAMEGVDVSVYQGEIDFSAVADDGIEVVYIRSSYGYEGVDENFRRNYELARAAGLKVGFYHFLEARAPEEARLQARRFSALIRELDYQCRPVLDYELTGALRPDRATAIAGAFLETVEAELGVRPMVYCDVSNARRLDLGEYPLWVAEWDVDAPDLRFTAWEEWAGWQYTDAGRVAGIAADVDRDTFTDAVLVEEEPPAEPTFDYTVVRGDTLSGIARRFLTTVDELVRLNNIADPDRIYAGEVLKIPCLCSRN